MVGNLAKWPSKRGPISKIRLSNGCGGDAVPLAVERWFDCPEIWMSSGECRYREAS